MISIDINVSFLGPVSAQALCASRFLCIPLEESYSPGSPIFPICFLKWLNIIKDNPCHQYYVLWIISSGSPGYLAPKPYLWSSSAKMECLSGSNFPSLPQYWTVHYAQLYLRKWFELKVVETESGWKRKWLKQNNLYHQSTCLHLTVSLWSFSSLPGIVFCRKLWMQFYWAKMWLSLSLRLLHTKKMVYCH